MSMSVQVAWIDRKGDLVGATTGGKIPLPPDAVTLTANTEFVPEYGQTTTTSQQEVIQKLATQIVAMMEMPW
jgi:hypothetical protein